MDLLDLKLHAFSDYFLPESQTYFSLKTQRFQLMKVFEKMHRSAHQPYFSQIRVSATGLVTTFHYKYTNLASLLIWGGVLGKTASVKTISKEQFVICRFLNVSDKQRNYSISGWKSLSLCSHFKWGRVKNGTSIFRELGIMEGLQIITLTASWFCNCFTCCCNASSCWLCLLGVLVE